MAIGNIKCGFNRLFVVVSFAWAIYFLFVYPLREQAKAVAHVRQDMQGCYQHELGSGAVPLNDCLRFSEAKWHPEQWALKNFYVGQRPFILAVLVAVPVLVYGIVRGTAAASLWIWRGYKATA